MLDTTRDRIGAACGAAFIALILVGNAMNTAGTTQSGHATGQQVLKDTAHTHSGGVAVTGFVLEVLGFVAFMGFLGYLAGVLRRRASGRDQASFASGTAIVAGVTMLAIKLGSAAPGAALDLDRKTLSPQLAQLLNDIGGAAFVISWLPFAVFVGAMAAAIYRVRLVGRPTAYIGIALGVLGVPATIIGLHDIANANPVVFLLSLVWVFVVCVRLAVKPGVDEPAPQVPADERVAVTV